tara:strand:- start:124 stop:456 length:333 start_codon:yes stop_codon:yes gene_type:complete
MNDRDSNNIYKLTNKDYEIKEIKKEENFSQFVIKKEDHTIGNSLQMELLENKKVIFSGYRIPHPLKYDLHIKVKTKSTTKPRKELINSIKSLQKKLNNIEKLFKKELSKN